MPEPTPMDGLTIPHFVLVPLPAQGHTIPMVDIAHLLAERGVTVTFVTTPVNAARIRKVIDRAEAAGLPIGFLELRFPCAEAGLPEGCENVDLLPSLELTPAFFRACGLLREPLLDRLREPHQPPASCIVSDMWHLWTQGVADELGVPRLIFHGTGCFPLLCMRNIRSSILFDEVNDDTKPLMVPGLPHRIEITKGQSPFFRQDPESERLWNEMLTADEACHGVVVNSFHEMESLYIEGYQKAIGKKAWAIGPVCLYNKNEDVSVKAVRGNKSSDDGLQCLAWLDSVAPRSVVYASFGSVAYISPSQHVEIGEGLKASNHPFVWVIKPREQSPALEQWLAEGFVESTEGRGFVIRGWAPQVAILSHSAVGGFVTHCGWNSCLEAICAGVPVLTWPFFAEQFLNERLMVSVLGIGVAAGVNTRTMLMGDEIMVKREAVEESVRKLMDGGEEGEERRKRTKELGEKARKAMEVAGSSYQNMTDLIQEVSLHNVKVRSKMGREA
ncbi:hypothetical protein Taro_046097 [Colocasia esculenta]|uniref:Glycosyltransferase n=1 Tax=Colocasia esculenta TaxID=4460 RepID=A0A843X5P2_COLES|nr:hypothetical protein [Colocasia esculenta]